MDPYPRTTEPDPDPALSFSGFQDALMGLLLTALPVGTIFHQSSKITSH
jgi:hypothetical protein